MPVAKGKRNKGSRMRGRMGPQEEIPAKEPIRKTERARVPRRGWQPPMWVNLMFGTIIITAGVVFFLGFQVNGLGTGARLLFLVGYFALGGLYLGRAFRQYRSAHPG
jgi:hypothetical protein